MNLIIAGAKGSGLKALQVIEDGCDAGLHDHRILGFLDDNEEIQGTEFFGYPILGTTNQMEQVLERVGPLDDVGLVCPIGNPMNRLKVIERLSPWFDEFPNVIHPSAQISKRACVGRGNLFSQNVVIQAGVHIGDFNTFNIAAVMGPMAQVSSYCTVNGNVFLASESQVNEFTYVGMGASVMQGITIGRNCVVGANAFVNRNVKDSITAVGVPAKALSEKS